MRKASLIGFFIILAVIVALIFDAPVVAKGMPLPRPIGEFFSADSIVTGGIDTVTIPQDTAAAWKLTDSTFLEQLTIRRDDSPSARAFATANPFYLKTPSFVQREVKLDSTGKYVIVRETVGGKDIKVPVTMPLEEYVKQRTQEDLKKTFQEMITKEDEGKKKKDDLGDILSSFTNIDIPVPANPVFSIFGPPRINLMISGAVDIRAAFRNTKSDQQTISVFGNERNEPDFAQEVQINVNGTIGDKLNILADWNTQRTFEFENQLRIKYTGYEDEVVQSVEAGNVSLSTSSSFVSSSSALFGIKAGFQIGPLKLTAIASQKKGQIQEKTVTGGSQEIPFEKRAYEYSKDHFFVDSNYIQGYENFIQFSQVDRPDLQIKDNEFEVYVQHIGLEDPTSRQANAYLNLPPVSLNGIAAYDSLRKPTVNTDPGRVEVGRWDKLEPVRDYRLNLYSGVITINRSIQDGQAIGIAYRIENGAGSNDDLVYGTLTKNETGDDSVLVLKLIKPKNLLPQYKDAWKLMLKNIYPLGGRKISKAGFELNIYYKESGKEEEKTIGSKNIIEIFGLDNYTDTSPGADGVFDFIPYKTIDEERGEIIFPTLKPFTEGITAAFAKYGITLPDTTYIYDNLYDTNTTAAQNNTLKDKFIIKGKTTASSSNTISLGFNIVEGSVQVLLDGRPLTLNVDYTVDYIIGQVIIKNQAALVPGANLQIKFEQNDLFQLASKTLLGMRGEVNLSEKTKFGFTIMNLDQQTLSDKVRLNEEPINNTIYGFDGQTSGEMPFLTKALDALPLFDTKAKSEFTLRGEVAYMSPDPNTKKSPIADDKGAGIAYIDDFEGAKRSIPLGVGYGLWRDMSPPAFQSNVDVSTTFLISDTTKIKSKAKTFWYNPPIQTQINEIYGPQKKAARGQDLVTILNINYNPKARGTYNFSPDLRQTLLADPKKNWGGVQRLVSGSAIDLVRENINFIELYVRVNRGTIDSTRKIYIDLGTISEDVLIDPLSPKLDTEDKGAFKNGILNEGEDTGIDGLTDAEEKNVYASFLTSNTWGDDLPNPADDPSGDNWVYSQEDFRRINGTELNQNSEIGRLPDTEDLNRNGNLDRTNNYYEYELNLDTTDANPLRVGGGYNGWFQYRIPLSSFKNMIGSPDFSLIEFIRVWFTGHDEEFDVSLVEFNLIGNQWEELVKNDSTLKVSVVSIEENSLQGYESPKGVIREQDKTKPDEDVLANEQSLALIVTDLKDGESRQAIKRFSYRPLDVFSYREMKMFVHGDAHFNPTAAEATAKLFVRFGSDSLNYYEYKAPVYKNWDEERNSVKIRFEDLTSLKQGRDSTTARIVRPVPGGPDSATYAVLGNPTLTRITFISIGIENPVIPGTSSAPISGQVWVNELRLADVDDTPGWAYSVSTNLKLADLGSIAFTYSQVDPFFHNLESRFGSRVTSKTWNVATSVAVERFFPQEWAGTTLPFSYSHSEQVVTPLYLPSSDILVSKAADQQKDVIAQKTGSETLGEEAKQQILTEAQTLSITDTYALPSIKFNVPVNYWLFTDFFNRIGYSFSYTRSSLRSPTVAYQNAWQWNARINYGYTFSPNNFLRPVDLFGDDLLPEDFRQFQFYYIPLTSVSTGFSMARSRRYERLRSQPRESDPVRGLSASRNLQIGWKLTEGGLVNLSGDYSVDIGSSLVHQEVDRFGRQRDFGQVLQQIFLRDQVINFGYDNGYNQSFNVNTRPRLPSFWSLNKYITLSARYSVSYRWQNTFQQGDLGIGAGWGNNISFGTDVSLKSFVDSWFPKESAQSASSQQSATPSGRTGRRGRDGDEAESPPETPPAVLDTAITQKDTTAKRSFGESLIGITRTVIKTPFLDYDKVSISYTQTNSAQNNGVPGRPGFTNFFGKVPFLQKSEQKYGPSRAYQLGLVATPGANITDIFIKKQFPFIGFSTDADQQIRARVPNASLTDAYSQNNKITLRTGRELWTGARIDLNWSLGWDYSRTQSLRTDSLGSGRTTLFSSASGGAIERSFMTFPPTLIFSMFKSGIEDVGKKYNEMISNTSDTRSKDEKLSEAFETGFESLPILRKIFGQYLPRVNYSFRWDGLEKMNIFNSFATRVSLDHAYQSTYRTTFKGSAGSALVTESQRITYAFSPLIGMNITFKEVLKGNMTANVRYGSSVSYDLTPSARNINETVSNEMSLTGSYGRTGFEIPLFGLALQNDIDISFTYTYAKNSRMTYDAKAEPFNVKGTPGEGSSRTQMEPRIRYVLSSRVTASLFYRYTKIAPDEGGSRIPGSTSNEGGLDVHIAIQ
ncbi:MAG: T9SS outer membrane translocon Sov/SprA [Bacteroidota bacterium]